MNNPEELPGAKEDPELLNAYKVLCEVIDLPKITKRVPVDDDETLRQRHAAACRRYKVKLS